MQLRSGRRLDPLPPPGRPRRRRAPRRPEAGAQEVDRISSLPDDLLLDILSRLGCAQEAARTSVLAKRWRGLWKRLPELTFGVYVPLLSLEGLLAQVTRPALNLLEIDACRKWDLEVPPAYYSSILRAAQRLAPKDLTVILHLNRVEYDVDLPCFHRTTSLGLWLPDITLTLPPAGEFTALQSLQLHVTSVKLCSLLPMCPSLRYLYFTRYDFDLVVVHPMLEELEVHFELEEGIDNMEIVTPLLKEARFNILSGKDFSLLFSAPMVEEIEWRCECEHGNVGLYMSHGVHTLHLNICYWENLPADADLLDADRSFGEEIQQLPFSQFSVLVLNLQTKGHAFGPLVLHLLQIRPIQKLEVTLDRAIQVLCPLDCPCDRHTNWRNESISLTELEMVTIRGFHGEDDEIDFLKVLFRCATVLKSTKVYVAAGGYNKVCGICEQYPHVKCDVSISE